MSRPAHWLLAPPASRDALLATMREWQVSPPVAQVLCGRDLRTELLALPLELTPNPALREAASTSWQRCARESASVFTVTTTPTG
ncbi:hypothetical protein [Deinococcus radiodurans]|uniref:hypothetical protein n=1 Tax=Deinococcus radiodurans TaxID=1299 RepID=UPI0030B90260